MGLKWTGRRRNENRAAAQKNDPRSGVARYDGNGGDFQTLIELWTYDDSYAQASRRPRSAICRF
jgi:hypothetical protein